MIQKLIAVFIMLIIALSSFAQRYHFVYIQADNQQPFYVKYGSKNYSSSSIGYLILPKLSDGDFAVQIGFPKNLYPEQTFNLSVAGKDYGYALKNFDAKGWGLFNFQTTDIVMNVNAAAPDNTVVKQTTTTNKNNPFGNMLADAINDSTLNQQRVVTTKDTLAKKVIDSAFSSVKDSLHVAMNNMNTDSSRSSHISSQSYNTPETVDSLVRHYTNTDSAAQTKTAIDSSPSIVKSSENTTSKGTDLTFLDNMSKDTIHAFIPSSDTIGIEKKAAIADTAKGKIDNPFFANANNTATSASQSAMLDSASNAGAAKSNTVTNSSCQKMFSSYDADKLKKKIKALNNQDDVLQAVRKSLRDKCITTEQVQDLGNLFLSDENRYGFYDAVYPSVSDFFNYPQLQNTLIDTYYKNRFKALLRQP